MAETAFTGVSFAVQAEFWAFTGMIPAIFTLDIAYHAAEAIFTATFAGF